MRRAARGRAKQPSVGRTPAACVFVRREPVFRTPYRTGARRPPYNCDCIHERNRQKRGGAQAVVAFTTSCVVLVLLTAIGLYVGVRRPVGAPLTWGEAMVGRGLRLLRACSGPTASYPISGWPGPTAICTWHPTASSLVPRYKSDRRHAQVAIADHRVVPDAARPRRGRHLPRRVRRQHRDLGRCGRTVARRSRSKWSKSDFGRPLVREGAN